eukprot:TRINITY_DN1949_c0_g1_i1.p1 TRINITY_DN1949_c0_g1~~TRINITY_DN1949_c0_g1_i1.p1  ORF type:complete len:210 (-),score=84.83 TRINITY_DN1949_c0_g1_i1:277-906(-)
MSKKKGLSFEDKRKKMMEIFFDTKDIYLLKDLERVAPKMKGITSMSVKEVVTSLVDDGMVDTDKIGTSVYFWAFPSKAAANRKRKLDALNDDIATVEKKLKGLENELKVATAGREESDERDKLLERLTEVEQRHNELGQLLQQFADNDPAVLQQKVAATRSAVENANRWTDNIFNLQSWVKRKFPNIGMDRFNKEFDIPDDLDYIEMPK